MIQFILLLSRDGLDNGLSWPGPLGLLVRKEKIPVH
jgi:hypothetical protein